MNIKKISLLICLLVGVLFLSACDGREAQLKEIRDRGVLRVGVKVDVPYFGHLNTNTNQLEGLEIDLVKLIAQDLFGDPNAVKMVGVTAQTRELMLNNGELDIVIATFTITEERKKSFHFTEPYVYDEIGFLVKKDSGLKSFMDMNGKTIGTVQSGTARNALVTEAAIRGIELKYQGYANYPEVKAALLSDKIDAFAVDKSILLGYQDDSTIILEDGFNPQPYGIATKLSSTGLAAYLDDFMKSIKEDGRLEEILTHWGQKMPE